jgi:predicted  nucleic acid-binding Zn-ribbon protein
VAEPDALHRLLDVQDRDLQADQLRHRRASLPERAALTEQEATLANVDGELEELRGRLGELQRTQKRLEDEIATVEAKAEAENTRLYSGSITSPRELQALQDEIDGLTRRQRSLEDDLLGVLEAAEPLTEQADGLEARRAELTTEADRLRAAIAEAEAEIDGELAALATARDAVAADVPAPLLATYERIRARLDGIGAARLDHGHCTGCHLALPATELDALKRSGDGAIVTHEECGRILVP